MADQQSDGCFRHEGGLRARKLALGAHVTAYDLNTER